MSSVEIGSMGQLQAETMSRPGLLGLWILGKKSIHQVLGVMMMRFFAVAGNILVSQCFG